MGDGADDGDRVDGLIESQREFYDLRAPDFGDEAVPDRRVSGNMASELARPLIDEFAPAGDVLELACGNGGFTRELVRHARTVTAIDASPRMLERNRREVADSRVIYVNADIFDWQPERRYDAVFFGFWLSHIPPVTFDEFWALVRSSLRTGGRVAFVDEGDRGTMNDDIYLVDNVPVAPRPLRRRAKVRRREGVLGSNRAPEPAQLARLAGVGSSSRRDLPLRVRYLIDGANGRRVSVRTNYELA